jgi:hypothetical protein
MRLLLDECMPSRFRLELPEYEFSSVKREGWEAFSNGALLAQAADKFDGLLTIDKNLPYQRNQSTLPMTVIVLSGKTGQLRHLKELVPRLRLVLRSLPKKSYVLIQHDDV